MTEDTEVSDRQQNDRTTAVATMHHPHTPLPLVISPISPSKLHANYLSLHTESGNVSRYNAANIQMVLTVFL